MDKSARIGLMGPFTLWVEGEAMGDPADKSHKGAQLLQYLILQRGEWVPVARLTETLWDHGRVAGPENALKTLVSRLRAALNQRCAGLGDCLGAQRGAYRFQLLDGLEVDLYQLEALLDRLAGAGADEPGMEEQFAALIQLYGGGLLPGQCPDWAKDRAESLKKRFVGAMYTYLAILNGRQQQAQEVCRAVLKAVPGDEDVRERLCQYALCSQERPVEDRQAYYLKLMEVGRQLSNSLEQMRLEIKSQGSAQGALLCDYAVFKEMYALHMRNLERMGTSMYLGLVMVGAVAGQLSAARQEEIMGELGGLLQGSLRKGDTIAQMNANTYALLLPMVDRQTSVMVMERLKRAFARRYPGDGLLMAYRVGPISECRPLRKGKGKSIC